MMIAALYSPNGHLVTGKHHGDAFGKLTDAEQNSDLKSGFLDTERGKFICDEQCFYIKSIIMMRHGEWLDDHITPTGQEQIQKTAQYLSKFNLAGYHAFSSPISRCHETSKILEPILNINFQDIDDLQEQHEDDLNFQHRLEHLLDHLPEKSLVVTHSDVIMGCLQQAHGPMESMPIPLASVTIIQECHILCVGEICR